MDDTPRADYTTAQADWRSVKCAAVNWFAVPSIDRRTAMNLSRSSRPDSGDYSLAALTLGELADMGVARWRFSGIGTVAIEGIKLTIDYAASGFDVTKSDDKPYLPRKVPYIPRPIKRPEE